jgi:hypothetical protein
MYQLDNYMFAFVDVFLFGITQFIRFYFLLITEMIIITFCITGWPWLPRTACFFKEDIVVGDRRHLLFYTDNQLDLQGKAKIWYMDGTFRVVKDPFQQLFSINAFVQSGDNMKQIPLVFVIMSGKSTEDYYQVCIYFILNILL